MVVGVALAGQPLFQVLVVWCDGLGRCRMFAKYFFGDHGQSGKNGLNTGSPHYPDGRRSGFCSLVALQVSAKYTVS